MSGRSLPVTSWERWAVTNFGKEHDRVTFSAFCCSCGTDWCVRCRGGGRVGEWIGRYAGGMDEPAGQSKPWRRRALAWLIRRRISITRCRRPRPRPSARGSLPASGLGWRSGSKTPEGDPMGHRWFFIIRARRSVRSVRRRSDQSANRAAAVWGGDGRSWSQRC